MVKHRNRGQIPPTMKTLFSIICLLLLAKVSSAQESIIFSGKIEKAEYNYKKNRFNPAGKVKEAEIIIHEGAKIKEKLNASKKGDFSVMLEADYVYKIQFLSKGYVSKCVEIDTRNLTVAYLDEDRKVYSDIRLFERVEGVNFSHYEKLPVAKCAFNYNYERMSWNMDYAEQTYSTFLNLVDSRNGKRSSFGVKQPLSIANETITEEEIDYTKDSEWLDSFLYNILAKL